MNNTRRVCIIIPAYNEAKSLANVISNIRKYCPEAELVVVNDASTDDTVKVARSCEVPILDLTVNLGIGGAVQTGLKYAWRNGFDVAMQVDGDGQHDPKYISNILNILDTDQADMVIGSRFMSKTSYHSSFMRLFGIRLFSMLIGVVTNKHIYDTTSGFRAYNKKALGFVARYYPQDFPEPESIVMMIKNGFRVKETPVEMKERQSGRSSVRPLKAVYFVTSNAIAIMISAIKPKKI